MGVVVAQAKLDRSIDRLEKSGVGGSRDERAWRRPEAVRRGRSSRT